MMTGKNRKLYSRIMHGKVWHSSWAQCLVVDTCLRVWVVADVPYHAEKEAARGCQARVQASCAAERRTEQEEEGCKLVTAVAGALWLYLEMGVNLYRNSKYARVI